MNDPIPIHKERNEVSESGWRSLKAFAFVLVLLGPIIPLTILLWKLAVAG